jgi:glycosyltransferase involved in cell wall biosynthesis
MPADAPLLHLALVGCGEVTQAKHLPALVRVAGVRVVAVADPDAGRRERAGDQFHIPHRVPDIDAVFSLKGIDAVGIAVPPASHAEVALAAVASRLRHVPVAVQRAQPAALVERALAQPTEPSVEPERPFFSIVVPTFNRPAALAELLRALCAQDYPSSRLEVVLVNDGGACLADVVAPFRDRLRISLLEQNHAGCAAARQLGAANASGRWLAFTDDDCRPASGWMGNLEQVCRAAPDCAISGTVRNGLRTNLCSETTQLLLDYLALHSQASGRSRFSPTNNLAFPAAAFASIGGMDANWPVAGGEDRELCARWLRAGFGFIHAADAVVFHYHALHLASFWRQHFNYGCGAHLFRARVAASKHPVPPFEPARFYLRLPLFAFRRYPFGSAAAPAVLLGFAQMANAAGFLWHAAGEQLRRLRGAPRGSEAARRMLP